MYSLLQIIKNIHVKLGGSSEEVQRFKTIGPVLNKTIDYIEPSSGGSGHDYSENEQVVGTWIDGKPLYEKSFYFNNKVLGTTNANSELEHGLTGIDMAFVEKALWKFTNDDNYWNDISTIKTQSGSSPSYWHGQMAVGDTTFYDTYNGNTMNASTSRSYIIVVRYTKATDTAS